MLKDAECFTHIYLRTGRTDMRLGIDGLLTVIENEARKLTKQQFCWLMKGLSIEQKKVIKDTKPDIY